jgi:hypothetical protein
MRFKPRIRKDEDSSKSRKDQDRPSQRTRGRDPNPSGFGHREVEGLKSWSRCITNSRFAKSRYGSGAIGFRYFGYSEFGM